MRSFHSVKLNSCIKILHKINTMADDNDKPSLLEIQIHLFDSVIIIWASTSLSMQVKNSDRREERINNFQKSDPKMGENRFLCKASD